MEKSTCILETIVIKYFLSRDNGPSPNGKALDSDSSISRFESLWASYDSSFRELLFFFIGNCFVLAVSIIRLWPMCGWCSLNNQPQLGVWIVRFKEDL